ncbi:IS110 family RNA-guided transposase [Treponema sp. R80B11-R83G3]
MNAYVGVDLHKTQFTVCVRGLGEEQFALYPTTEEGYKAFLKRAAIWQGCEIEVKAAVESTGNTRHFKNRLEEAGVGVEVINTMKFKVVNESVKKTDRHDAATIAEFLEKDMLPHSHLCSRESEEMRRLLKARTTLVRAQVVMKNQIHALLTAEGFEDAKGSLQSKRGRKRTLDALKQCKNGLAAQTLMEIIDRLEENVNLIEKELRELTKENKAVELLKGIPGCGEVCAWTIIAYTDDVKRFASAKKYASYAGLAPWVQNSNETVHHGRITKRGPEQLRTALVQVVMGMRRMKKKTLRWRLMERHEMMKRSKGSGKTIIATARKIAVIIWNMLTKEAVFEEERMTDRKLLETSESMKKLARTDEEVPVNEAARNTEKTKPAAVNRVEKEVIKKTGVARKRNEKAG